MQARNKVVVRARNGQLVKGYAFDFNAGKERFHVVDTDDRSKVTEVLASDLKAVFYVRSFDGDSTRTKSCELAKQVANKIPEMKVKVTFSDGEVLFGTTNGYSKGRPGFFVTPSEPSSNNNRAFVFVSSTTSIESWR